MYIRTSLTLALALIASACDPVAPNDSDGTTGADTSTSDDNASTGVDSDAVTTTTGAPTTTWAPTTTTGVGDSDSAGDSDAIPDPNLPPECMVAPVEEPGVALDLHGWEDSNGHSSWQGTCAVTDVAQADAIVTTFACGAEPEGPTTITLTFVPTQSFDAWSIGQDVKIVYGADEWNDGAYLAARSPDDDALLAAIAYGGGDGGFPSLNDHVAPLAFDEDYSMCGAPGASSGYIAPLAMTVSSPGEADDVTMLQGDELALSGALDEQYGVALYRAETGDLNNSHYGSWIELLVHRLP
ncbi:MAG: hypothetical protein H6713_24000 [Myxococcales bacterium]|nr:hypothetical protein [Myxococcales bacterium]MCB9753030.1 hypothetical protein [Myxococcales bacterium]